MIAWLKRLLRREPKPVPAYDHTTLRSDGNRRWLEVVPRAASFKGANVNPPPTYAKPPMPRPPPAREDDSSDDIYLAMAAGLLAGHAMPSPSHESWAPSTSLPDTCRAPSPLSSGGGDYGGGGASGSWDSGSSSSDSSSSDSSSSSSSSD